MALWFIAKVYSSSPLHNGLPAHVMFNTISNIFILQCHVTVFFYTTELSMRMIFLDLASSSGFISKSLSFWTKTLWISFMIAVI